MEKKQSSFGKALRSDKLKRGSMATLMSVIFIAIVVVVNILMGVLTDRFPSLNVDMTAQKLNTLSDQAAEVARNVENDTRIYLIGAEESYRKDRIYGNYGFQYSQVANLAERLAEVNPRISVKFVDPDTDPKFISDYQEESLITGKVLVETDRRHKVLTVNDMFAQRTNQETGENNVFSKVDGALAGALEVVNMEKVPVLAVATGHEEALTGNIMASFQDKLENENFEIREVNFLTEEIPEDTQILMLPTPIKDYTVEELQKIRDYLNDDTLADGRTLLVTCHPGQSELPNLASFLEEWGVRVEPGSMVVETDSSRMALGSQAYVLVDAEKEVLNESTYNYLIAPSSSPIDLLFEGNGDVLAKALWTTSDKACVITEDMTEADLASAETSSKTVASLSYRTLKVDGRQVHRSVAVFGSSMIFQDTFINASAFDNSAYITDLLKYLTGTSGSSVSVYSDMVQTNVMDVTASQSTVVLLGLGVFTVGIPLIILVAGLVIFLKRRHL